MAKSKSTTTTPKAKSKVSTPKSAPAIPAVLTTISPANPAHDDDDDDLSDAASAPVAETATPARKQTKRKAPQDDEDDAATAATTTSTTKKPKVSVHTEQASLTSTSASGKKATQKHRNVRIEIPASSLLLSTPAKGKHIVFNDADDDVEEDPSEFFTPQEDVKANSLDAQLSKAAGEAASGSGGEGDDDDDDAPEAVSTSTAAAQAAKATEAAARAVELQQDEERRKRKERDAKFRKQAEARKKQQASTAPAVEEEGDDDEKDDDVSAKKPQPEGRLVTSLADSSRKRLDRRNLPAVLPDEFLESDSEAEEEEEEDTGEGSGRAKKITFNTAARQVAKAEPRHPADQRVGATVYRVMKKQGEAILAPRGGKYSKNAKEMLMGRGRTVPKTGVKKKGFLVR